MPPHSVPVRVQGLLHGPPNLCVLIPPKCRMSTADALDSWIRCCVNVQGRFGSQQVDAEEFEDSEEGGTALGEMVEGLVDDLLEKVDASLDCARAQLKANPGTPADGSVLAGIGSAPAGASQVAGAQPCNLALYQDSWDI